MAPDATRSVPSAHPEGSVTSSTGPIVDLTTDGAIRLYRKYAEDLARARRWEEELFDRRGYSRIELRIRRAFPVLEPIYPIWYLYRGALRAAFPGRRYLYPFFGDLNCELLYLLVRELKPKSLVEVSPSGGWSTSWILNAIRDNGFGQLTSCDLIDDSARVLPKDLTEGRWTFLRGDVFQTVKQLPDRVEFLLVDALHTAEFARWYVDQLFPRLAPEATVVVDDIFHTQKGMFVAPLGSQEGQTEPDVVMQWLRQRHQPYYTVAESVAAEEGRRLYEVRRELGLSAPMRRTGGNPAIFFQLGHPAPRQP